MNRKIVIATLTVMVVSSGALLAPDTARAAAPAPYLTAAITGFQITGPEVTGRDPATGFDRLLGPAVYAVDAIGEIAYITGSFTGITDSTGTKHERRGIAALNLTSRTVVAEFRADVTGIGYAVKATPTAVYFGGDIDNAVSQYLFAVDPISGTQLPFAPRADAIVQGLALIGGKLWVAGRISKLDGQPRLGVGVVDPTTGAVDAIDPKANSRVGRVALSADGNSVFIGGEFTSVAGQPRAYLARLNLDGTLTSTVYSGLVPEQSGGPLILDIGIDPLRPDIVYAATAGGMETGNSVIQFGAVEGERRWSSRAEGDVQAVAVRGDRVYIGFHECYRQRPDPGSPTGVSCIDDTKMAAFDPSGGKDPNFVPSMPLGLFGVFAIKATPGGLLVVGAFRSVDGAGGDSNPLRFAQFPADPAVIVPDPSPTSPPATPPPPGSTPPGPTPSTPPRAATAIVLAGSSGQYVPGKRVRLAVRVFATSGPPDVSGTVGIRSGRARCTAALVSGIALCSIKFAGRSIRDVKITYSGDAFHSPAFRTSRLRAASIAVSFSIRSGQLCWVGGVAANRALVRVIVDPGGGARTAARVRASRSGAWSAVVPCGPTTARVLAKQRRSATRTLSV